MMITRRILDAPPTIVHINTEFPDKSVDYDTLHASIQHNAVHLYYSGRVDKYTYKMLAWYSLAFFSYKLGYLIFNSASFRIEGRNVLVLGQSGTGKSTMARILSKAGYEVLDDDMNRVNVEKLEIHPGMYNPNTKKLNLKLDYIFILSSLRSKHELFSKIFNCAYMHVRTNRDFELFFSLIAKFYSMIESRVLFLSPRNSQRNVEIITQVCRSGLWRTSGDSGTRSTRD